ncbi:MAG: FAD-dependent monooxygenase [Pseudomonadota bacterium]
MAPSSTPPDAMLRPSLNAEFLVAGDGPVGLMAALALADAGRETLLIAPSWNQPIGDDDSRTTAILGDGISFLEDLRIWPQLAAACAPLKRLRIVNAKSGPAMFRRGDCTFDADEIGEIEFGWNVPATALKSALMQAAAVRPHLRLVEGKRVRRLLPGERGYAVELDDGQTVDAGAIIAADGRGSKLRQEAGIDGVDEDLDQTALVCSFDHAKNHDNTSIELHRDGGPFTTVPLPGRRSSLVWVMPHDAANALIAMPPVRFFARLEHIVRPWLGRLDNVNTPGVWPLRRVLAATMARENLLLVGETAHAFSPVGAQGLNLSIRDIRGLRELVEGLDPPDRASFGASAAIALGRRYSRRRLIDVQTRAQGVHMLNDFVADRSLASGFLQEIGLQFFKRVPILRQVVMQTLMPPRISSISLP